MDPYTSFMSAATAVEEEASFSEGSSEKKELFRGGSVCNAPCASPFALLRRCELRFVAAVKAKFYWDSRESIVFQLQCRRACLAYD